MIKKWVYYRYFIEHISYLLKYIAIKRLIEKSWFNVNFSNEMGRVTRICQKKIHNMLRRGCKVDLQKRPLRQEVIRS